MFDTLKYLLELRDLFANAASTHGFQPHASIITVHAPQDGTPPGTIEILTAKTPPRGSQQDGSKSAIICGQFHAKQKSTLFGIKANGYMREFGRAAFQADNDPGLRKHQEWAHETFKEIIGQPRSTAPNPLLPDDQTSWTEGVENWTRDRTPTNLTPLNPTRLQGEALRWKNISPSPTNPNKAVWLAPVPRIDGSPTQPPPKTQLKVFPDNRQAPGLPLWQWCYIITPFGNEPRIAQPDHGHYVKTLDAKKKAEDFAQDHGWTTPNNIAYPILWAGPKAQILAGPSPLPEIEAPLADGAIIKPTASRQSALAVYRNPLTPLDQYKPQPPTPEDMNVVAALKPDHMPVEVTVDRFGYVVPWAILPGRPPVGTVPPDAVSDLPDKARTLTVHLNPKHPPLVLTTIKQNIPYAIITKFNPTTSETRIHTAAGHTLHILPPTKEEGGWDILLDGKPLTPKQIHRRFGANIPEPGDEHTLLFTAIQFILPHLLG